MEHKRTFETLDEVFEHIDDPGFLEALNSYIEEMPCNRETVDQLIDAADSWDIWEIYDKLLVDCNTLLTAEKRTNLRAKCKRTFDVPLSDENIKL